MDEAKLKQRGDNDVEKRHAIKEGSKQSASKQAVGVSEPSLRENKDRLQFGASERHQLDYL
jgi:hypothetical protein